MSLNLGPQNLYVIPVNSLTNQAQPYSIAELTALFTGPTWQSFWFGASYGQFGPFTVTVAPYQTLNDSANPVNYNSCPSGPNALMTFGIARLKALYGNTPYFYDRQIYALPAFGCNVVAGGGGLITRLQGRFGLGDPLHEIGHSLGQLEESSGQTCDASGCRVYDYDDPFTPFVGSGGWYPMLDFAYTSKLLFGWVGKPGQPSAQIVTQSGDYQIEPLDGMLNGRAYPLRPVALTVQTASGTTTIEHRATNTIGVLFHRGTTLLDLAPTSSVVKRVLGVGDSCVLDGVTYTTLSVGPTGATLHIDLPGSPPLPLHPPTNPRAL